MTPFKQLESEVQSYARSFPVLFSRAKNAHLFDQQGRAYLDFLAGAGSLNYGHNNPLLKQALLEYISDDGITHSLDLHTEAKGRFMTRFDECILKPRELDYKMQFTGPTGTNSVEAAIKLARKVTGRSNVLAFTNGFHGCTLGALGATGNQHHRGASGVALGGFTRLPYEGYAEDVDGLSLLEAMLSDKSSGLDLPAAVLLEVIQGEGGLNCASAAWLQRLDALCHEHGILLIVDDIQAGCGRSGRFFSFEGMGIHPDMITLSKSLSGYGLPFAMLLLRPDLDVWTPGEHNGTFRGNNHAFITATKAVEHYWADDRFAVEVRRKSDLLGRRLERINEQHGGQLLRKGRGMMQGLACADGDLATSISRHAFSLGLIIETCGPEGEVVKCFAPLTISEAELNEGLDILAQAIALALAERQSQAS